MSLFQGSFVEASSHGEALDFRMQIAPFHCFLASRVNGGEKLLKPPGRYQWERPILLELLLHKHYEALEVVSCGALKCFARASSIANQLTLEPSSDHEHHSQSLRRPLLSSNWILNEPRLLSRAHDHTLE